MRALPEGYLLSHNAAHKHRHGAVFARKAASSWAVSQNSHLLHLMHIRQFCINECMSSLLFCNFSIKYFLMGNTTSINSDMIMYFYILIFWR